MFVFKARHTILCAAILLVMSSFISPAVVKEKSVLPQFNYFYQSPVWYDKDRCMNWWEASVSFDINPVTGTPMNIVINWHRNVRRCSSPIYLEASFEFSVSSSNGYFESISPGDTGDIETDEMMQDPSYQNDIIHGLNAGIDEAVTEE